MEIKYFAEIEASFLLDDEEFATLFESAQRHYDTTVKLTTEQGGFLFGFRNKRTKFYDEEEITDVERTVDCTS